jgi:hypothetical protein
VSVGFFFFFFVHSIPINLFSFSSHGVSLIRVLFLFLSPSSSCSKTPLASIELSPACKILEMEGLVTLTEENIKANVNATTVLDILLITFLPCMCSPPFSQFFFFFFFMPLCKCVVLCWHVRLPARSDFFLSPSLSLPTNRQPAAPRHEGSEAILFGFHLLTLD